MASSRVLLLACALCAPGQVQAQEIRDELPIEPAALYSAMLGMTERSDWPRLEAAYTVLAPLAVETDKGREWTPGDTFRSAIDRRDGTEVRNALFRFVVAAAADVLVAAKSERDPIVRREMVRTAFAEFVSISPILKAVSFDLNRTLERDFRAAYVQSDHDLESFAAIADALAALLEQVGRAR